MIDNQSRVQSFVYRINDDLVLKIVRAGDGFTAEKATIEYEKRVAQIAGVIEDNLISSIGDGRDIMTRKENRYSVHF